MGSERKRPARPTSSQTLAAQKSAVREMAGFEPRTYFLRFLVRRGPLGQNLRIFEEKISISTGKWMPRTALLRAVPSDSTTEPP